LLESVKHFLEQVWSRVSEEKDFMPAPFRKVLFALIRTTPLLRVFFQQSPAKYLEQSYNPYDRNAHAVRCVRIIHFIAVLSAGKDVPDKLLDQLGAYPGEHERFFDSVTEESRSVRTPAPSKEAYWEDIALRIRELFPETSDSDVLLSIFQKAHGKETDFLFRSECMAFVRACDLQPG